MTPLEILTNIGKLIGFMGVAMFVGVSCWAQFIFWRTKEVQLRGLQKKSRMLYHAGKWEFICFTGVAALMIAIAVTRLLWRLVTTGW